MNISRPMAPLSSRTPARWALRASFRSTRTRVTRRAAHRIGSRARTQPVRQCGGRRRKIGTSGDGGSDGARTGRPLKHSGRRRAVHALAHFLAGLEVRHTFLFDRYVGLGTGIAAGAWGSVPHRKRTEAAQLDAVAARHRGSNLAEDDVHDFLNVVLPEMRVLRRDALHEFGFDHRCPSPLVTPKEPTDSSTESKNDRVTMRAEGCLRDAHLPHLR